MILCHFHGLLPASYFASCTKIEIGFLQWKTLFSCLIFLLDLFDLQMTFILEGDVGF